MQILLNIAVHFDTWAKSPLPPQLLLALPLLGLQSVESLLTHPLISQIFDVTTGSHTWV